MAKTPVTNDGLCAGSYFYLNYTRPLAAEFLATAIFVFAGSISAASGNLLIIATVHGIVITLLVVAFLSISGGHMNPGITLTMMLLRSISVPLGLLYMMVQISGGIAGAAITRGVLEISTYNSIKGGSTFLGSTTSPAEGLAVEFTLSFFFYLVVVMSAVSEKSPLSPLAIGLVLLVDIIAGGTLTGCAVNPARALGPAIIYSFTSGELWSDIWLYIVGPILGALLTYLIYRFHLMSRDKKDEK